MRILAVVLALTALSLACATVAQNGGHIPGIHGAEEVEPNARHVVAYEWMVECVGPDREVIAFEDIRFFVADSIFPRYGKGYAGIAPYPRIYINRTWEDLIPLIAHEILHLLLPGAFHGHPEFEACDPMP